MKTIRLLTIFLFVSFFQFLNAQVWTPTADALPDSFGVSDISIVNNSVIWASATNWYLNNQDNHIPMFLLSTDGGEIWTTGSIPVAIGGAVWNIEALNKDTAFITTHSSEGFPSTRKIFRTTNGGSSWEQVLNGDCGGYDIHFFDAQYGIANCWQVGICYTIDGGTNWLPSNYPDVPGDATGFSSTLTNSYPVVGNTMWFGSRSGRILRSTDMGMNWDIIYDFPWNNDESSPSLAFSDIDNGLCLFYVDQTGTCNIYRTEDGGNSWNILEVPDEIVLQEICHIPGTDSTFVGVSWDNPIQTAITCDYGATWEILDDSIPISSLSFYSTSFGLAAEGIGLDTLPAIYKFNLEFDMNNCATIVSTKTADFSHKIKVTPNPFADQIFVDLGDLKVQELTLINASGQIVWSEQSNIQNQIEVTIPNLVSGIYFLKVKTKEGLAYKKLVKM